MQQAVDCLRLSGGACLAPIYARSGPSGDGMANARATGMTSKTESPFANIDVVQLVKVTGGYRSLTSTDGGPWRRTQEGYNGAIVGGERADLNAD
jgi:hypothetical protein